MTIPFSVLFSIAIFITTNYTYIRHHFRARNLWLHLFNLIIFKVWSALVILRSHRHSLPIIWVGIRSLPPRKPRFSRFDGILRVLVHDSVLYWDSVKKAEIDSLLQWKLLEMLLNRLLLSFSKGISSGFFKAPSFWCTYKILYKLKIIRTFSRGGIKSQDLHISLPEV